MNVDVAAVVAGAFEPFEPDELLLGLVLNMVYEPMEMAQAWLLLVPSKLEVLHLWVGSESGTDCSLEKPKVGPGFFVLSINSNSAVEETMYCTLKCDQVSRTTSASNDGEVGHLILVISA